MARKNRSRAFLISFVATLAILIGLFGTLYFSSGGPQASHLPENIPKYDTTWGRYAPADAVLCSFENLTLLHSINSSLPPEKALLQVVSPSILLNNSEVESIVSIVLASPNATLDIAFVQKQTFERFSQLLAKDGQSPVNIGDSTIYEVTVSSSTNRQPGWIATIPPDQAIAFSVGTEVAKDAISESLSVLYGHSPSILSRTDVTQMLYTLGGASSHLGVQIQNFPGLVRTGEMTLVSVDASRDAVAISYVIKFTDAQTALGQYDAVKSAYLSSHQFSIYDNYVKAVGYQPLSSVEGAIRVVE